MDVSKTCHGNLKAKQKDGGALRGFVTGQFDFSKFVVNCLTTKRKHGAPFKLQIKFIDEKSPLKGVILESLPITVCKISNLEILMMIRSNANLHGQEEEAN